MSEHNDILLQCDGKPWVTDDDRNVPKKCPTCGADMGLYLHGEPVFLCKRGHYYGTLRFPTIQEAKEDTEGDADV